MYELCPSLVRLSKSLLDISAIKKSFLENNDSLLYRALRINATYNNQPRRTNCKSCLADLPSASDFVNHNSPYSICRNCGHLNGLHDDTQEFSDSLYKNDNGSDYSQNYLTDYDQRVTNIYRPKLDFLISQLQFSRLAINSISDFGCGGGHFINCINPDDGFVSCTGYDISSSLIRLAKDQSASRADRVTQANPSFFCVTSEDELLNAFRTSPSQILSMLGVLEHLQNPRHFFESFSTHTHAKYLFIQVPLFGLSTYIEHSFPNVFPRVLSSGHTHLFTRSSLAHLLQEFNLTALAEWHFGTDSMDLKRSIAIQLRNSNCSEYFTNLFDTNYYSPAFMDDFQSLIDRNFLGSQTHLILRNNN